MSDPRIQHYGREILRVEVVLSEDNAINDPGAFEKKWSPHARVKREGRVVEWTFGSADDEMNADPAVPKPEAKIPAALWKAMNEQSAAVRGMCTMKPRPILRRIG